MIARVLSWLFHRHEFIAAGHTRVEAFGTVHELTIYLCPCGATRAQED